MKARYVLGSLVLGILLLSGLYAGDWDITVFRPAVNPRDKKDNMVKAGELYKKETGGKVTFILGDWGSTTTKVIANLAAGTPIDVFFASSSSFPRYYTKKYCQPLDGWVDLSAPNINIPVMDKFFKYEGKYYLASNKGSNHSRIIIYNKTLMEEEGIKPSEMPLAQYKKGTWTFDAMRDLAMKLTKDTDKDGKTDRWGFGGYDYDVFINGNGVTFTTVDNRGQYKLNFEDPRILQGLNYLFKAYTEGWFTPDPSIATNGIVRRTLAMWIEGSWQTEWTQKETKDEIESAPIPLGPGNKEKVYPFSADGYTIGAGSKKQKAAGKYIDYCLKTWNELDEAGIKIRPQYVKEYLAETGKRQLMVGITEGVLENVLNDLLGAIAWGGADPKQRLEAIRPLAQAAVDDANEPPEVPTQLPFNEISVDFENGDISAFSAETSKQSSVKFSVVSDKRAIEGKSLLINLDSKKDGSEIAVLTNPEKLGVVGYRNYLISFDAKLLKDPSSADTAINVSFYQKSKKYGLSTKVLTTKDEKVSIADTFRNIFKNGKLGLRFLFKDGGDVVIDNIKIKEVK